MKAEILNREIANVDNMKEVLYDKILTLIKWLIYNLSNYACSDCSITGDGFIACS